MINKFFRFSVLISTMLVLFSCSKYQKLLKSTDYELKLQKANEYYQSKDYARAMTLYDELLTIYKGTVQAEDIYFYYAYCNYYQKDYILAGYYFRDFARTFPVSKNAEEAAYMGAYCYFLDSPEPSLDQENTIKAIQELQLFINTFPESQRIPIANELIDKLRYKLETKAYENANLYYNLGDYRAAIVAYKNALFNFPDTQYREELMFMLLKTSYLLAINSVPEKKNERLQNTVDAYDAFINSFPDSKMNSEATNIYDEIKSEIIKN